MACDGKRTYMRQCEVQGCARTHLAKGLCQRHYHRMWKYGSTECKSPNGEVEYRLYSKTIKQADGCLIFTGCISTQGYGSISVDGKMRSAHIVSYELVHGPVPFGYELDHLCNRKVCINPEHLEPVTHKENMRRSSLRRRGLPIDNNIANLDLLTQYQLLQKLCTEKGLV